MSSGRRTFGLQLALWYATLFVSGSIAIVFVTYYLTATSLAQRDQQIIRGKLGDYAAAYQRAGLRGLAATVRAEQQAAPERLFVRVVDRGLDAVVLSNPEGWNPSKLEIASASLADGTLVQVGKSTEARDDLLARFRATLGVVTLLIVLIALTGGWVATQSALSPIRRLTQAVQGIIQTGRTNARVPAAGTGDAIDLLTSLFNTMLDKIEGLVTAMRGALDNVSHDLRTPLTRLRGSAEVAMQAATEPVAREALSDCVEESDRVLTMLTALMSITEAEAGVMHLNLEKISLTDVLKKTIELYELVAEEKKIAVATDFRGSCEAVVDPIRMRQVFANLLDNALKYTPEEGKLKISCAEESDRIVVKFEDSGMGIPVAEQPRIWERLYRGDKSRSQRGLGLGLSLVKAIVEAHYGKVAVRSEPGQGSEFTVWLPKATAPSAA